MYVCLLFSFCMFFLGMCLLCVWVWTQVCRRWTKKRRKGKRRDIVTCFFLWERKQRAKTGFSERENRERKLIVFLRVCRERKQKIEREKQKSKEWARGRVNYCHKYRDLRGVVRAIEEPRLNNTCPVYLFQVSSFYVFLVSVFFGFLSTQLGEEL